MTQEELIKLANRYDDKANRAYYNYQETGMPRYDRERSNAEDMAEALRMAANAADDHMKLLNLQTEVRDLAYKADLMMTEYGPDHDHTPALNQIISLAEIFCGYKRRDQI